MKSDFLPTLVPKQIRSAELVEARLSTKYTPFDELRASDI